MLITSTSIDPRKVIKLGIMIAIKKDRRRPCMECRVRDVIPNNESYFLTGPLMILLNNNSCLFDVRIKGYALR
jgi:hypothetical protein